MKEHTDMYDDEVLLANYLPPYTTPTPATLDDIEYAIYSLEASVCEAFAAHDHSLRAEVEKVNSRVAWLISTITLMGAAALLWPRRRT
jgi:hypothetical protein